MLTILMKFYNTMSEGDRQNGFVPESEISQP